MSDHAYLALYFDAPLQSWGFGSKFDRRTTLAHPTRSGVIGLLCAASGVDRADTEGLQRLDDELVIDVYTFAPGGRLTDYHTVGGGYDPKRGVQRICRKASGGTGTTVQTYREYLEDARFGAVVSSGAERINALAAHVQNPVWGIWLGRKACVPAARVFAGVHADRDAAVAALGAAAGGGTVTRIVREAATFEDGTDSLMDRPLDFNPDSRRFAPRRVRVDTE